MSNATAISVIRICDYMIGYHGRLIEQAMIAIAGSAATVAFLIGLAVVAL